jgi:putative transposase
VLVDTLGLILEVQVQPANLQDRDGAKQLLVPLRDNKHWRLQKIWADGSYRGEELEQWIWDLRQGRGRRKIHLEIVSKSPTGRFVVLPRRWVVERTFAWLGRSRRLSKDYEALRETSHTLVLIAMIHLMAKRLAKHHNDF